MRKTLFLPLLLLLLWQVPSYADSAQDAEFQRGWDAYDIRPSNYAFKIWKPLAESGHGPAQHQIGYYFNFRTYLKNEEESKKWRRKAGKSLKRSAESGDALAQYWIGMSYYDGIGVKHDITEAKKWYRKAFESFKLLAENGDAIAQFWLGDLYYYGKGVAKDRKEAFKWYLKAAKQGNVLAQKDVAKMYRRGDGVAKSWVDAHVWYSIIQDQSEIVGRFVITDNLKEIEEQLSPQQLQQALKKLVEQGSVKTQYRLGKIYEEGKDVPKSLVDAYIWYTIAKINGHDDLEKRGEAIEKKLILEEIQQAKAKAKQCIESNYKNCSWKTASDFNKDDNFKKGVKKFKRGVKAYDAKDYRKAFQIWKNSAESGHVESQYYLGILYSEGKGTIRNYKKSHLWYYNAAKQGHTDAQSKLGTMYSEGKGVSQNYINAYMWYSIAAANGADSSSLDYLERILSPEQLDQALAKAEQCFNSNYQNCG